MRRFFISCLLYIIVFCASGKSGGPDIYHEADSGKKIKELIENRLGADAYIYWIELHTGDPLSTCVDYAEVLFYDDSHQYVAQTRIPLSGDEGFGAVWQYDPDYGSTKPVNGKLLSKVELSGLRPNIGAAVKILDESGYEFCGLGVYKIWTNYYYPA